MKIKIIILNLLLLMLTTVLQAVTLDGHYQKMLAAYGKLNTWKAEIKQTNYFHQSKAKLTSNGNFYYQKGAISIRYNKPNEQFLVVKEGTVTVYDKSSNTAVKAKLGSATQSLNPVEIIKTYWKNSEKSIISSGKGYTEIQLKPKSDKQIQEIRFTLSDTTSYVNKLTYTDRQSNSVEVVFDKMQVNKSIPASVFKLDIPKTAQVIER